MAHRGRLNVLANILHKSPRQIFSEFEDQDPEVHRGGDVKYHLGHSNTWTSANGRRVHLTLCFNPSHLEFVNPVAEGVMRAKFDRRAVPHERGLPILIHGDAAFAGEGVVQETLNLSRLPYYATGGTIHVIVNNQIGFTTPPAAGRSTRYASDVAKMLPIADFPRQRRRARGRGLGRRPGPGFPPPIPPRRAARHVLLPPSRAQRKRRAGLHATGTLPADPVAARRCGRSSPPASSPAAS